MDREDLLQERVLQCDHDAVVFQSQKSWIEKTFFKRECCRFIASSRDPSKFVLLFALFIF